MIAQLLTEYLASRPVTAKALAEAAGISASSLSRWRQGQGAPDAETAARIAEAMITLAERTGRPLSPAETELLRRACAAGKPGFLHLHFDALLRTLHIQIKELAPYVRFMPSYLSKIRSGKRSPADPARFAEDVCGYVLQNRCDEKSLAALHGAVEFDSPDELPAALRRYLLGALPARPPQMERFLHHLDCFDLHDHMTRFAAEPPASDIAADTPAPHTDYYGLARIRQSYLVFFRLTLQSDADAPIFLHSDMPIRELTADRTWSQQWMAALAGCLKKGLCLQMIHEVGRALDEMLIGLEIWIPLYMTGQIMPYYFPQAQSGIFRRTDLISGAAYLHGEHIADAPQDAWYELDTGAEQVAAAQKRAAAMLRHALPLMEICTAAEPRRFREFAQSRATEPGAVTVIHPTLPLHTLPEGLLAQMLRRCRVPQAEAKRITEFAAAQQARFSAAVMSHPVTEILAELTEAQFTLHPLRLSLADGLIETQISYTDPEYCRHLEMLRGIRHPNYRFLVKEELIFRNMQITLKTGKWAVFTKHNSPVTHFIIHHPQMLYALQRFFRDEMGAV